MRILGITVSAAIQESAFLEKYASLLSNKVNRLSEHAKKQLILAFILISIAMLGGSLILGIPTENTTSLRIPAWEPPMIYYDSLLHKPITNP
ncbi:hypothetical protein U3A58_17495 [Algoriphagus sp. C2-6-M1]|uniref:hypothetical protein n=1 Tax=Algoriphagus persicinus TaxID=3108754 RepID=UPI002B384DF7|nr:hypothetical protein [Algoriphagus sp. C2-6-M1]MEB2782191.1 hypothetical protein [Algoriphagus sp. C2-6-M1]